MEGFRNFSFHSEQKWEHDHFREVLDFFQAAGECARVGGGSFTGREAESMDPVQGHGATT